MFVLGFISPGDLAMALLEFLDDNDFENNKAPKQRNIDATGDFERQVGTVVNFFNIVNFCFSLVFVFGICIRICMI